MYESNIFTMYLFENSDYEPTPIDYDESDGISLTVADPREPDKILVSVVGKDKDGKPINLIDDNYNIKSVNADVVFDRESEHFNADLIKTVLMALKKMGFTSNQLHSKDSKDYF